MRRAPSRRESPGIPSRKIRKHLEEVDSIEMENQEDYSPRHAK